MHPFDYFPMTDEERRKLAQFQMPSADRGAFLRSEKNNELYADTAMRGDLPSHHYSGYNSSVTPNVNTIQGPSFASRVGNWLYDRSGIHQAMGFPTFQGDKTPGEAWKETAGNAIHSVQSAFTAPSRAYAGEIPAHEIDPETGQSRLSDAMAGEAFNFAGNAMIGGGAAVKGGNATKAFSNSDSKTGAAGVAAYNSSNVRLGEVSKFPNRQGNAFNRFADWLGGNLDDVGFRYPMLDKDGNILGEAMGTVSGNRMMFNTIDSDIKNSLGVSGLRALREQIRADFPDVTEFAGYRATGAREDLPRRSKLRDTVVRGFSNSDSKSGLAGAALSSDTNGIRAYHGSQDLTEEDAAAILRRFKNH